MRPRERLLWLLAPLVLAITMQAQELPPRTAPELYRDACSTCHGLDGKGAPAAQLGFTDVALPDFTDCRFSSPEPDVDWIATIHLGGRARAFSRRMPAFTDALSHDDILRIVDYLRAFCTNPAWPRGDLNLPRPFVTEKAFPENEIVVTTTVASSGSGAVTNTVIYEQRLGARSQYEVGVPFVFQEQATGQWARGIGDATLAFKHVLFDRLRSGSIVSAGGEMLIPTGRESSGLGEGRPALEAFGTLSQMLPRDGFVHVHAGVEVPFRHDDPNEAFWRVAVGKTFTQNRWGRAWSPMMELVSAKEIGRPEAPQWDVIPQLQVSLSTRQHILLSVGMQIPMNQLEGRNRSFLTYLLWDWFDGGLFSGWR